MSRGRIPFGVALLTRVHGLLDRLVLIWSIKRSGEPFHAGDSVSSISW